MRTILLLVFLTVSVQGQVTFKAANSTTTKVDNDYTVIYSTWAIKAVCKDKSLTISRTIKTYKMYTKQVDERTFDIGLIFSVRPSTNMWQFNVEGAEDFDFFYQPILTPEEMKENTVERPEDVQGSIAVYYKDGMKGKVMHIYRPLLKDCMGATSWATLSYDDGLLKVVGDKDWLKNASYPVILDPTLGYTTIGGSNDYGDTIAYYIAGSWAKATEAGTCTSISFAAWNADADGHIKLALYDNDGNPNAASNSDGKPVNLITDSYSGVINVTQTSKPSSSEQFMTANITASLIAETTYWFCLSSDDGANYFAFDDIDKKFKYYQASDEYTPFPRDPIPQPNKSIYEMTYTLYVTYATGGATPPKPKSQRAWGGIIGE